MVEDLVRKQESWRKQKANAALAVLLAVAFMPSDVQGQSDRATQMPDYFEYFEGHGYMGGEWVKWEHDKLVFTKRVADMKGKGSFDETIERLEPPPQAWGAILGAHRLAGCLAMETRLQGPEARLAGRRIMESDSGARREGSEIERL